MKFNEDSRVKIPTILHLVRLGYDYLSLKGQKCDTSTNIFKPIIIEQENEELTKLRDWLLPMLMNGQVKVGDYDLDHNLSLATEPEVNYGI